MTTTEFDQLFTILTQSQYITWNYPKLEDADLELPKTWDNLKDALKYFRENYRDKLKDGANLVDLYRDALLFADNFDGEFGTEYENHFITEFWKIAREVLVEPEKLRLLSDSKDEPGE